MTDDWKISRYLECDGTVRMRVPNTRLTFAEARTIAEGFLTFLDACDPPALPATPPAGRTTTGDALMLLEIAAKLLREEPDRVIGLCKANGFDYSNGSDIAVVALGAVKFVTEGYDLNLVDDPPEGD